MKNIWAENLYITTFIALGSLTLTPHSISNRQTCQKEKCMINRLWYGNFHIIPHINPRHPYQPEGRKGPRADMGVSGWYGAWYENCHIIISIYFEWYIGFFSQQPLITNSRVPLSWNNNPEGQKVKVTEKLRHHTTERYPNGPKILFILLLQNSICKTVQIQIRLLLKEPSDQGLYSLLFY